MVRGKPSIHSWRTAYHRVTPAQAGIHVCLHSKHEQGHGHPRAGGDPFSSLDLRCVYGPRPVVDMALGLAGTPSLAS